MGTVTCHWCSATCEANTKAVRDLGASSGVYVPAGWDYAPGVVIPGSNSPPASRWGRPDHLGAVQGLRDSEMLRYQKADLRPGLLEAARLARDHDIGDDASPDRALDTLAEKLERLAGEAG